MTHVGDVGTVFTATVKDGGTVVDITGATIRFLFNPPGGDVKDKLGVLLVAASGTVTYTLVANDIDVPGSWTVQVKVTTATAQIFYADLHRFKVGLRLAVGA